VHRRSLATTTVRRQRVVVDDDWAEKPTRAGASVGTGLSTEDTGAQSYVSRHPAPSRTEGCQLSADLPLAPPTGRSPRNDSHPSRAQDRLHRPLPILAFRKPVPLLAQPLHFHLPDNNIAILRPSFPPSSPIIPMPIP
jgi:hypothetical protein